MMEPWRGNSILITSHYPDLGNFSDYLRQIFLAARPIRSTIQIWVVTRRQHGISALVCQTSFPGKTSGGVRNVDCFLRLLFVCFGDMFLFLCSVLFCYISGSKQLMVDFFRKLVNVFFDFQCLKLTKTKHWNSWGNKISDCRFRLRKSDEVFLTLLTLHLSSNPSHRSAILQ